MKTTDCMTSYGRPRGYEIASGVMCGLAQVLILNWAKGDVVKLELGFGNVAIASDVQRTIIDEMPRLKVISVFLSPEI